VTGASTDLGRALLRRLADRDLPAPPLGLDTAAPPDAPGADWRSVDVRDALLAQRLQGVSTVVHLATSYDPDLDPEERRARNLRGTAAVLESAREAAVQRVVLVTSTAVLANGTGTRVPLTERSPVRAPADGSRRGDLVELERLASHGRLTGIDVVVLRPAPLVGGGTQAYDGELLRGLAAPRLLAVRGVEPLWQLCHVDDLLSALEVAALGRGRGVLTVACDGWLPQTRVEELAGRRRLELPVGVAVSTAGRLHRLGVAPVTSSVLAQLLGPVVVTCPRLRATGWRPTWTNEAALAAHLRALDRPVATGAGTATAAGATVAVVGTAALLRARRRRRR
jgi:nucleoside-diphosphate-sugar epimerase